MLDVADLNSDRDLQSTFIEPYPKRFLLLDEDCERQRTLEARVQDVPFEVFEGRCSNSQQPLSAREIRS